MDLEKERSKEKLKKLLDVEVNSALRSVLDFIEVAVGNEERFKALRSKVLKVGNDALRNLKKEIDTRYDVEFIPLGEDVIKVKQY